MFKYISLSALTLLMSHSSWGLVSQPTPIFEGETGIDFRFTREGGVMKPSEDKASFQDANILISQISFRRAPKGVGLKDFFWSLDYRAFQTPEEKKNGVRFHDSYLGHQVTLGGGFNIARTPDYTFGIFLKASPLLDIDEKKFGNPRADLYQFGWNGGFSFGRGYFFEANMTYGSGIPDEQNQYLGLTQVVGVRGEKTVFKLGPYAETDLSQRVDAAYSATYSPNKSENIRLYKMGIIAEAGYIIDDNSSLTLTYLQKLFGQFLPSTNALSLQYSMKF